MIISTRKPKANTLFNGESFPPKSGMGEGGLLFTAVQHELKVIANEETPRNLPKIHLLESLSVIARYKVNLQKPIILKKKKR